MPFVVGTFNRGSSGGKRFSKNSSRRVRFNKWLMIGNPPTVQDRSVWRPHLARYPRYGFGDSLLLFLFLFLFAFFFRGMAASLENNACSFGHTFTASRTV